MSKFSVKLSLVILVGSVNFSLSSVAQAEVKWVKTLRQACPTICQDSNYKFAVPGGVNLRATEKRGSESVYYVCATHFSGWRIGYNIDYRSDRCYIGFRGNENYGESYYCLCSDQEIPPIGK